MRHKSLANTECPVARSLDRIGHWWTVLILRDAIDGKKRFREFQASLGITPNILTSRLESLVADGMMERQAYCVRPPRYEYILTARGRSFHRVIDALREWDAENFDGLLHKTPSLPSLGKS